MIQFSDAELYNQLRYFAYLFDVEKAAKAATGKRHGTSFHFPFKVAQR